jgi:hypothetical protein
MWLLHQSSRLLRLSPSAEVCHAWFRTQERIPLLGGIVLGRPAPSLDGFLLPRSLRLRYRAAADTTRRLARPSPLCPSLSAPGVVSFFGDASRTRQSACETGSAIGCLRHVLMTSLAPPFAAVQRIARKALASGVSYGAEMSQPQTVQHNRDRAHGHSCAGQDRAQQNTKAWIQSAGSNRDADCVIDECPE